MSQAPQSADWWDSPGGVPEIDGFDLRGGSAGGPSRIYSDPRHLARHSQTWVGIARLIFAVAENDAENIKLIRSSSIDEDTMRQRRAVIWAAKMSTTASLPVIARALNRDHSSVLRSMEEAEKLYVEDPTFRALCKRIIQDARVGHGGQHG